MDTRRKVATVLHQHIQGSDGYSCSRLAEQLEVHPKTIQRWCADQTEPTASELLDVVAAIQEQDHVRAGSLWHDLSALVGQESRPAPRAELAAEVEDGCLQVVEEAGHVTQALRRARDPHSPGGSDITPAEAAVIAKELREVGQAALAAEAKARSVPTPQLSLGGAR